MFVKSIRGRFLILLAFLLVGVLAGFAVAVYELQRASQLRQIDEELERRVGAVSSAVRGRGPHGDFGPGARRFEDRPPPFKPQPGFDFPPGEPPKMPGPREPNFRGLGPDRPMPNLEFTGAIAKLFDETQTNSFYFAVWQRNGKLLKQSTNAPPALAVPERADNALTHFVTRAEFREAHHFTELGECVLVGRSIRADLEALQHLRIWLLVAGGIILALGLGAGWWLVMQTLRPIQAIGAAAAKIAGGDLSQRINAADTQNELGQLASVLNSTFVRLEAAFAKERDRKSVV